MDSAKLNDWLQVVGIFALVASLIFVGLQMRQDRQIALARFVNFYNTVKPHTGINNRTSYEKLLHYFEM